MLLTILFSDVLDRGAVGLLEPALLNGDALQLTGTQNKPEILLRLHPTVGLTCISHSGDDLPARATVLAISQNLHQLTHSGAVCLDFPVDAARTALLNLDLVIVANTVGPNRLTCFDSLSCHRYTLLL